MARVRIVVEYGEKELELTHTSVGDSFMPRAYTAAAIELLDKVHKEVRAALKAQEQLMKGDES